MARSTYRVGPSGLSGAVRDILREESELVGRSVEGAVADTCDELADDIGRRAASLFGGTGAYAGGWTDTVNRNGADTVGVVYNGGPDRSLAHLLEYGHELYVNAGRPPGNRTVHAGRVEGRPHIAPAVKESGDYLDRRLRRDL